MTNYREILRLRSIGLSKLEIAECLPCSRNTVAKVLALAEEKGLKWPLPDDMSDKQLAETLFPPNQSRVIHKMPDFEWVRKEKQRSGVTLNQLWLEYTEACCRSGELPYQASQFNKLYKEYLEKNSAVMHIDHKPGEILQVDWAGDTATVRDSVTGEDSPAYLFVATLPYSGYSYVEAFFSMNEANWITANVNALRYFGGSPRIIQCDNLKTGVKKNSREEVVINRNYQEFAEYYNLAILPCRVRAPKDKAAVEGTVGYISRFILGSLRNMQFFSLYELNDLIWQRLEDMNHRPFQKKDGSRASWFQEEKSFLLKLPASPFEPAEWRTATVGPNYHISVDGMNYSVPYEYIKQKVDVRITPAALEVFFDGNRICSHQRLRGRPNQYSTLEVHMPEKHQQYIQWNGERFCRWAAKIGPNTERVIKTVLSGYKVEQQGYRSCMGILKLADKYSVDRLENACTRALTYTPHPNLKQIKAILSSGMDKLDNELPGAEAPSVHGFVRGADYYRRDS